MVRMPEFKVWRNGPQLKEKLSNTFHIAMLVLDHLIVTGLNDEQTM